MTALEKYLSELNKQKQLAESRFNNLNSFQNQLLNSSYAWLLNNLNLQGGVFDVPADLPGLMNGFVDNILKIADKSRDYEGALNNYITDLSTIKQNIDEFHYDFHEIAKNKPGVKDIQKAVITEVIDQYSENGLNKHFAQPLRELMFSNILAGMSQKDAKEYLQEYIKGGKDESGKLQKYLEQTAQQGVDSYTGAINMKLKKDFDFTGYIISGSLIDTSSKQCIYAIQTSDNGYLSFSDWAKVLQIARENKNAKLIDGTTVDNLPLNKLHWGCRHEFTPTIVAKDIKQSPKQAQPPKPAPAPKPQPNPETAREPIRNYKFVPVKTIPEAEDFARYNLIKPERLKYVEKSNVEADEWLKRNPGGKADRLVDVSFKGMSIEAANKINERILKEITENKIPLLNRIQARPIKKQGWAARMSSGGDLEINTASFKNLDKNPDRETITEFLKVKPYLESLKSEGKLTAQNLTLLKRAEEIMKFKTTIASENPIDIITHEMGHHLDNNILKVSEQKGLNGQEVKELIKTAIKETAQNDEYKYNLSYYAFSNVFEQRAEMFAEAFTLYRGGQKERLSANFIKLFDLVTK